MKKLGNYFRGIWIGGHSNYCISFEQEAKDSLTNIRQQWGVVRHGTLPLKSKISNNPPSKISAGHGRYPPPSGPENFDPP